MQILQINETLDAAGKIQNPSVFMAFFCLVFAAAIAYMYKDNSNKAAAREKDHHGKIEDILSIVKTSETNLTTINSELRLIEGSVKKILTAQKIANVHYHHKIKEDD